MALNAADKRFLELIAERIGIDCIAAPQARSLEEPRGRYQGQAAAVLRPRNTAQVVAIVEICNEHKVGIIPYGGGTGLVGGQILSEGPMPVLLSLERMNAIREVDILDNSITVEAGVILADIRTAVDDANRLFPLSLASEGSCQIGGNLATNAGGVNVLRYGNARELCLGIEAVLPDGTLFNGLKKLRKDNTGFDIKDLMIGSEGALGIITAATLRLFPKPGEIEAAFLAVPSPQSALDLLALLSQRLGNVISAFELIDASGLEFMDETGFEYSYPLDDRCEWMVLVDCGASADSDLRNKLENALAEAIENGLTSDAVLAQNESQRAAFWHMRETIPLANRKVGAISSHDISVAVSAIPEFIERGTKLVAAINPDLRVNCFGHLGDGNLHYNVFPPSHIDRDEYNSIVNDVKNAVHGLVEDMNGSFSAEHGVGRMKKPDLMRFGDTGKIKAMLAIKDVLDPNGIMNPGAVV